MAQERTRGLDIFRGTAIAAMIIVNNQGDWSRVYSPLRHAGWHGFTPADMIFPAFLFIAGLSLYLSVRASEERGDDHTRILTAILKRSIFIVILGLSLNFPLDFDFGAMRFPGVLQRIGICLALAALPVLFFSQRGIIITALALSAAYWSVLYILGPMDGGSDPLSPVGGLGAHIDSALFGSHRLKSGGLPGFEPEGLLSTLGALSTTLMGAAFGPLIRANAPWPGKLIMISLLGMVLVISGLGISYEGLIPLNKNLWSPSFVLLTAGIGALLLALFCYMADHRGLYFLFFPLSSMGMAPLLIYYLSSMTGRLSVNIKFFPHDGGQFVTLKQMIFSKLSPVVPGSAGSLAYSLIFLALWVFAAVAVRKFRERSKTL